MIATTTCSYTKPVGIYTGNTDTTGFPPDPNQNFAGQFPISPLQSHTLTDHDLGTNIPFQYGSSTCVTISSDSATSSAEVLYGDFLFVSLVIIFLLSFTALGYFFSIFKPHNDSY